MSFWKVAGKNGKKLSPKIFLSYQKRFSPTDAFIIMQLFANDFRVRTKVWKNNITRNSSRSVILTLLTLLSADAKPALLLRVPSISKVEVLNFPLLHFSKWLRLVHWQLALSQRCVKRSVICKCQCFCFYLFDIQQLWILS